MSVSLWETPDGQTVTVARRSDAWQLSELEVEHEEFWNGEKHPPRPHEVTKLTIGSTQRSAEMGAHVVEVNLVGGTPRLWIDGYQRTEELDLTRRMESMGLGAAPGAAPVLPPVPSIATACHSRSHSPSRTKNVLRGRQGSATSETSTT